MSSESLAWPSLLRSALDAGASRFRLQFTATAEAGPVVVELLDEDCDIEAGGARGVIQSRPRADIVLICMNLE